ncbi:MAG: hypothetical protein AAFY26_27865, partial [Cyanobacteria bacterium J06638_22]
GFTFSPEVARGTVEFRAGAIADVASDGGGSIRIVANTIDLSSSSLYAGIGEGLGTPTSQAGTIVLEARDRVRLSGTSQIFNDLRLGGSGTSGNVQLTARDVQVLEGSQISASTFGRGNSGSVHIVAGDRILFSGIRPDGLSSSAAFSNVNNGAVGNGGNLRLAAPIIELRDGAQL